MDTHTDRLTDRQTQSDFIIFPMLYAIAVGRIKSNFVTVTGYYLNVTSPTLQASN